MHRVWTCTKEGDAWLVPWNPGPAGRSRVAWVGLKSSVARVYMPVWGAVLSDRQIADLVSYIRAGLPAIAGIAPQPVRTDLGLEVEGQQLYIRYGCVVCHAFNGFGGVPNPASP